MWNLTHPTVRLPAGWKSLSPLFALLSAVLSVGTVAGTRETASELAARWEGRWVVITGELSSGCADVYTNNRVRASAVHSEEGGWERKLQRFGRFMARQAAPDVEPTGLLAEMQHLPAGELGSVHQVNVRGNNVDLLVDLQGRFLIGHEHGPFTLYREAHCKVQLQFAMPNLAVKNGDIAKLEEILAQTVERYESEPEARGSSHWNGRGDDNYPPDYEDTLRAYTRWRNAEIDRTLDDALALVMETGADLSSSSAYYDGFFRGVDDLEPVLERHQSCETLVGQSFEALRQEPGMGEVATKSRFFAGLTLQDKEHPSETLVVFDRRGYEEGQRLLYALTMLERLPQCREPEGTDP